MFKKIKQKNTQGFTLVEMMIYLALMTVIAVVIVQSIVVVLKSNRSGFAESNLRNAAYSAFEGMVREIHASDSIIIASSGLLQLNQSNPTVNVVQFSTSSDARLNLSDGGSTSTLSYLGPLISKDVVVKSLIFTPINTGKSQAIRIQMNLTTTVDGQTKSEWFYDTAILKGSY